MDENSMLEAALEEAKAARGVETIDLDSSECRQLLESYIAEHPDVRNEEIGRE